MSLLDLKGVKISNLNGDPAWRGTCDLQVDIPDPRPATRDSIQALIEQQHDAGGNALMGLGRIPVAQPLLIDYSKSTFDAPRINLRGESDSSTLLLSSTAGEYALKIFGGTGEGQVNKATHSDFQIIRAADGALGASIVDTAGLTLRDVILYGLDVGLYLEAVQISTFQNVHTWFGDVGVQLNEPDAFVTPFDSLSFNQCTLQGRHWGMRGGQLANLCLFQTRLEGSGVPSGSTGPNGSSSGVIGHGGLDLHFGTVPGTSHFALDYGPGLNMAFGWCENNCGEADIILTNDGTSHITHTIIGVPFSRVGPNNWCTNFIKLRNPNGGSQKVDIYGSTFAHFNGYKENETHPYIDADANSQVECHGCVFASKIEQGNLRNT